MGRGSGKSAGDWSDSLRGDSERLAQSLACYIKFEDNSIRSADLEAIAREAFGASDPFTIYALDRLLRIEKVYDPESWILYSEAPAQPQLERLISERLLSQSSLLPTFNHNKQVEFILEREYGFLLDEVQGLHWQIEEVDLAALSLGATAHLEKLDQEALARYQSRTLPLGIAIPRLNDERLRVIDGYHRITAARQAGVDSAEVIVGR